MTTEVSGADASFFTKARLELLGWNWSRVGRSRPSPASPFLLNRFPSNENKSDIVSRWSLRGRGAGRHPCRWGVARQWPAPHCPRTRTARVPRGFPQSVRVTPHQSPVYTKLPRSLVRYLFAPAIPAQQMVKGMSPGPIMKYH
ncbi:hypothetical protein CORC01_06681 [Colletotrichum orchidophilum]|uniref:Uncharacterized protein n=1 Tax=Colletotrichum orchidophilum TaxID=1209926 RepID=A0A1G4B9P8_9PEZI|nr:uncharacterized protein CORC01_06681 [Colletotrichum orchidophilum]OHE98012.1 hypothetical protein CORC01_06681 [Colletotrichum orchidophilum]